MLCKCNEYLLAWTVLLGLVMMGVFLFFFVQVAHCAGAKRKEKESKKIRLTTIYVVVGNPSFASTKLQGGFLNLGKATGRTY